ncbi:MAG TPA: class I SAM-dependent methyltransferase [Gaiellaceae bacterium]|nr:class I SAM-dependent methyltransferase [Gaiellaceae bacterium]
MTDFAWDPDAYLAQMAAEIPGYDDLQDAVAAATRDLAPRTILELGVGTGETALRVLALHPAARLTGIDSSEAMLERARKRLPHADLRVARLEDPLPGGPFDLVVSVLAVHHLDGTGKRDLFARVSRVAGAFVLGDVVVPEHAGDAAIEIDGVYDTPSSIADQLTWLDEAGFDTTVTAVRADLAVLKSRLRR